MAQSKDLYIELNIIQMAMNLICSISKRLKVITFLIAFVSWGVFAFDVSAQQSQKKGDSVQDSTKIRQLLERRDQEIKELLGPKGTEYTQEQRDKLKDIINNIVDYRTMARKALQTTFDTLTAQKQDEFVDLFSQVVRDQSLNKMDIYRADVKYQRITINGDSAYIETMARLENTRTPVYYTMEEQKEGWVVTDMIIDEVSTVASYRRSFQNIINKKGFETLMETLRKRLKK